ncbi:flagellar hook-length control protein FliK [Ideonella sp. YS5]|uniref:flagellar hook-length control protein FliK n=1 Tax=Ideonella sp. YS5 TaxID=3453714 RepID=UPI003EECCFB4
MTPTAAPTASSHATASHAASQAAARSRPAQGGQGASPFAQLLQGMADEGEGTPPPAAEPDESTTQEADERPTEHGKAQEARRDRDPADDATAQATPEVARMDLTDTARQASTLAAARAKAAAGIDAARNHRAAMGLDGSPAEAHGNAGASLAHAGARDAQNAASNGLDLAGWQATLDATPVNLAPAESSTGAAAAADFSLPSLGATAPAPAPAAEPPAAAQATLAPPPGSPAFGAALGAQLSTWLKDGVQYATLELNPQDMGPIDVRIALRDGRTEVQLGADVAATRAALTEALPGLTEALGDVGLTLTGGSVSDQTGQHARQGEGQAQRGFTLPSWLAPARDDAVAAAESSRRPAQRGLIDLVA